jgi:hypothetical protein
MEALPQIVIERRSVLVVEVGGVQEGAIEV